jgi:PKD repeat protein
MRKLGLIALLAALTALAVIGCSEDDPKPAIARLVASESCGVAPLRVDFRADATGGVPLSDPTGSNNWLKLIWDFGDGTVIDGGASVAYHEYAEPGTYEITVTAEDDDGERASRSLEVVVQPDSLTIEAYSLSVQDGEPATEIAACIPMEFGITAETCGFDPVTSSYERFVFRWSVDDSVYTSPTPRHSFAPDELGERTVQVRVVDPTRDVVRRDTLQVTATPSAGADVSVTADWTATDPAATAALLQRDIAEFPDRLTYTIRVQNDGPEDAYNLSAAGNVSFSPRIFFETSEVSSGSFAYDASTKLWSWDIPRVPAGGEATLEVGFYIEVTPAGQIYSFPATLDPYPCDLDDDDLTITAQVEILSVP